METNVIKVLVCTLDDDYKRYLSNQLNSYDTSFITDIDIRVMRYYRVVIVDANTFTDTNVFMKYSDFLYMQNGSSVIIVRPTMYIDYVDIAKISEDIIITEDIKTAIDKIVTTNIGVLRVGDLIIDAFERKIYYKNELLSTLTPKYLFILQEMIIHFGELVESKYLMELLWGNTSHKTKRCMDVMIRYIKEIVSKDETLELKSIYAEGYILKKKGD